MGGGFQRGQGFLVESLLASWAQVALGTEY